MRLPRQPTKKHELARVLSRGFPYGFPYWWLVFPSGSVCEQHVDLWEGHVPHQPLRAVLLAPRFHADSNSHRPGQAPGEALLVCTSLARLLPSPCQPWLSRWFRLYFKREPWKTAELLLNETHLFSYTGNFFKYFQLSIPKAVKHWSVSFWA